VSNVLYNINKYYKRLTAKQQQTYRCTFK